MEKTKTGSGRRRWTRKQRQGLLARFHESQFTQSEFATQHGVGLSTLSKWLFIGHPEAGERSAVIYTLLGSCRRHGVNPFEYLKDLFTRLPATKITQISQFTPAAWGKAKVQQTTPVSSLA